MEQATSATYDRGNDESDRGDEFDDVDGRGGTCIMSSNENSNKKDKLICSAAINESYMNVQKDCEIDGMHLLPEVVLPVHNAIESSTEN